VLTDSRARVLSRADTSRTIGLLLDRVSLAQGFGYAEDEAGTNGIGTVLESGASVQIVGAEHYVDVLQPFACAWGRKWYGLRCGIIQRFGVIGHLDEMSDDCHRNFLQDLAALRRAIGRARGLRPALALAGVLALARAAAALARALALAGIGAAAFGALGMRGVHFDCPAMRGDDRVADR